MINRWFRSSLLKRQNPYAKSTKRNMAVDEITEPEFNSDTNKPIKYFNRTSKGDTTEAIYGNFEDLDKQTMK